MKLGLKRTLLFLAALVIFVLVIVALDESQLEHQESDSPGPSHSSPSQSLPVVSFIVIEPKPAALSLPVFGELLPKWDVLIRSQVNGELSAIPSHIESGTHVSSGDLLGQVEPSAYEAQVEQAKLVLAQAKLEYLQTQQKSDLALMDWKRSGLSDPPTDLMLFKPQLAIAKQALKSAESQLQLAKRYLSFTQIKAPFSGVIVERSISKGQAISEGEGLFRLLDDQILNLEVALGEQAWSELAENWQGQIVTLYSTQGQAIGQARLVRGGHFIDQESRQYRLFLEVTPDIRGKARAGQFVNLNLPGRVLENVLSLPESALTQDGSIWLIDADNLLREYQPKTIHRVDDRVIVTPPPEEMRNSASKTHSLFRIATLPLAHFNSGKHVAPMSAKDSIPTQIPVQAK